MEKDKEIEINLDRIIEDLRKRGINVNRSDFHPEFEEALKYNMEKYKETLKNLVDR